MKVSNWHVAVGQRWAGSRPAAFSAWVGKAAASDHTECSLGVPPDLPLFSQSLGTMYRKLSRAALQE